VELENLWKHKSPLWLSTGSEYRNESLSIIIYKFMDLLRSPVNTDFFNIAVILCAEEAAGALPVSLFQASSAIRYIPFIEVTA
jgi:hypothetical protein